MSKTDNNVKAAFAGESQAHTKYLAFADKADKDGLAQIAKLFRAAGLAELIHAHNHLKANDGVNTTAENLEAAIAGETYEVDSMYPEFITDAKEEEDKKALRSFNYAIAVEKQHQTLYSAALENIDGEQEEGSYYVCPVCGSTHFGAAPDKCPVCGALGSKFIVVN